MDGRELHERVRVLARRYDAIAAGASKLRGLSSVQDAANATRDAKTLHEAADALAPEPTPQHTGKE